MINLNLKFSKGSTDPVGECGNFAAGIDVSGVGQIDGRGREQVWFARVEVYGKTAAHADELRDQVLAALNGQPATDAPAVGYLHRLHTECGDITRFSDSSACPFGRKGHDYDPSYSTSYKKLVEVE